MSAAEILRFLRDPLDFAGDPVDADIWVAGFRDVAQPLTEAANMPLRRAQIDAWQGLAQARAGLILGPPGTGKTLIARACAAQTNAAYLKLAGPLLVQMFIGDGAKLVRDAFDLAKEKVKEDNRGGAIIFIDELDAIGTKRFDSDQSGDREVQRTMLELLNQLDGARL